VPPLRLFLAVLAISVLVITTGCDPGHEITFKNETSAAVTIFFDGREQGSVGGGQAGILTHLEYSGRHTWEAKDPSGHVLYHAALRWADIRGQNWIITISGAAQP
jgi:hypothetical protein